MIKSLIISLQKTYTVWRTVYVQLHNIFYPTKFFWRQKKMHCTCCREGPQLWHRKQKCECLELHLITIADFWLQVSRRTARFMRAVLFDYYKHVTTCSDTMLTRFCGMHAIRLKDKSTQILGRSGQILFVFINIYSLFLPCF